MRHMGPYLYFNSQSHEETDYNAVDVASYIVDFNSQSHEETDGNL